MLRIITTKEGLRPGNIVLVDEFVYPPNFICAQPRRLPEDEDFEELFADPFPKNMAYLNLSSSQLAMLSYFLSKAENCSPEIRSSVRVQIKLLVNGTDGNDLWKWRITSGEKSADIHFVHELQNYYEDWTGHKMLS